MFGKGGNGILAVGGGSDPYLAGGGAGNPRGISNQLRGSYSFDAENGTGGLLIIYSKNIINNSYIISNGSKGGYVMPSGGGIAGGGCSGAGSINLFYMNNIEKGNVLAQSIANGNGGAGGNGSITIGNIRTGTFQEDGE